MIRNLNLRIWLGFFLYSVACSVAVQFIILPYLVPSLHGGHGLLNMSGAGDLIYFHNKAAEMAILIRQGRWSEILWIPFGGPHITLFAFIYVVFGPHPWVLIPLQSGVHATAAYVLAKIIQEISGDSKRSWIAALPFLLFPSSMFWFTQTHKDDYIFLGCFLAIWCWQRFYDQKLQHENSWRSWWVTFGIGALAIPFSFLGRGYLLFLISLVEIPIAFGIIFSVLKNKKISTEKKSATCMAVFFLVFAAMSVGRLAKTVDGGLLAGDTKYSQQETQFPSAMTASQRNLHLSEDPYFILLPDGSLQLTWERHFQWHPTSWLSPRLEKLFVTLGSVRDGFRRTDPYAPMSIDFDTRIESVSQAVHYIPRAVQIGLFSPFPTYWIKKSSSGGSSVSRLITSGEMLITYLLFPFGVGLFLRLRRSRKLWIAAYFSLGSTLPLAMIITNLGTLYRPRFGMFMVWVAFGTYGAITAIDRLRERKARKRTSFESKAIHKASDSALSPS